MTNYDERILDNVPIEIPFPVKVKSFKFERGGHFGNYKVFKYKITKKYGRKLSYDEKGEYEYKIPSSEIIIESKEFDRKLKDLIKYFNKDFGLNTHICDGEWFEFKATLTNGEKLKASGYNYFPKTYNTLIEFLEQNAKPLSINEKCLKLPILKTQKVEYIPGKGDDPNVIYVGCFDYPEDVRTWHNMMYELELIDFNYGENITKLLDLPIEILTRDNILTIFTYILRSERFGDGVIASELESGRLEKLCKRLQELIKKEGL